jgi:hypothetical protein
MADVRILLTDKMIAQLPTPKAGWYLARDTELKGFFVVVGESALAEAKGGPRGGSCRGPVVQGREGSCLLPLPGDGPGTCKVSFRCARAGKEGAPAHFTHAFNRPPHGRRVP